MTTRTFCTLAAAIFALIAVLQLIRIVMGWSITLNGIDVPFWASWIAVIVTGVELRRLPRRHAQLASGTYSSGVTSLLAGVERSCPPRLRFGARYVFATPIFAKWRRSRAFHRPNKALRSDAAQLLQRVFNSARAISFQNNCCI